VAQGVRGEAWDDLLAFRFGLDLVRQSRRLHQGALPAIIEVGVRPDIAGAVGERRR
jgi:hypothetical protein